MAQLYVLFRGTVQHIGGLSFWLVGRTPGWMTEQIPEQNVVVGGPGGPAGLADPARDGRKGIYL